MTFIFQKTCMSLLLFTGSFLLLTLSPFSASAEQMLQILPPRIVLTSERSANLTLINRGDKSGDYRLFMRNIRTNEYGKFFTIETPQPGDLYADSMIRFSPRKVTVPAQSKQDVRVVLRKPKDLAEGEYRSHLVFRSLPKQEQLEDKPNEKNIAMTFNPILEVTIPVIVRHGNLTAALSFSDINITTDSNNEQIITLTMNRSGNRSVYGDINIWWQKNDGEETRVAAAKGVSVYFPNAIRIFSLAAEIEQKIEGGKLRIQYIEDPSYGGDITAESVVTI